ncbi:hypothetical protein [Aeromonas salmonicida]|uniref:hypothetical protein n=1 Tax=Aeromonas salmonicida TaxID=645 RepID=UPI0038BA4EBE
MKLSVITPVVTSIMTLLLLSPQFAFADTVNSKDSVNISVTGFVEAETCKLIEAEMPELDVNMGTFPLAKLQEMRDKGSYTSFPANKTVSFKCDGSAKLVNFTVKSNASKCTVADGSKYLCNEAENGATVGLGYGVNWMSPTGEEISQVIYGPYDMNTVNSGKIDNGAFDFNLRSIFYSPYKSHEIVSPGEIKGHLLVTVWNI